MKQTVVAVFAHPDDEAFGPGGTLAKFALNSDVYIVAITGGEAGQNSLTPSDRSLSDIRKEELLESAKIMGVKEVFFLGFEDGTLSNNLYHKIASRVENELSKLKPDIVITFEQGGVSGHIDHIATHFITTFVVKKLENRPQLWYYFAPDTYRALPDDYFIYFPPAKKTEEADEVVDTTEVWEIKKKAMLAHKSQVHDATRIIGFIENLPKRECFCLFKD